LPDRDVGPSSTQVWWEVVMVWSVGMNASYTEISVNC
jgi:hypothetical protein